MMMKLFGKGKMGEAEVSPPLSPSQSGEGYLSHAGKTVEDASGGKDDKLCGIGIVFQVGKDQCVALPLPFPRTPLASPWPVVARSLSPPLSSCAYRH